MESSFLQSAGVQNLLKSLGCASLPNGRIVDTYDPKWRHLRTEGIGADGLSGQVDNNGPTGPSGGSPYSGEEEDQLQPPVSQVESDVLAFSGSGPLTFTDPQASLPWNGGGRGSRKRRVRESEGYFDGHPTDATLTGRIQILVMDDVMLKIRAPFRILEQIEAYKFFEQFQFLLPRTPMLNANVMESIARWWRNFAEPGDLLEIDCTNGYTTVTNERTNNIYSLGSFGSIPTYSGIVS